MGLLIRQDVVEVQNYSKGTGAVGQSTFNVPDGAPIKVKCNVYPAEQSVIETYGLQQVDTRLVVCDSWPGNIHSTIAFEGAVWEPATPVAAYRKTVSARSVQLHIRKRGE